jgi:cyclase
VHAYLQLPGHWGVNNVGIVRSDDAVLLIDTTQTPERNRQLQHAVRSLTTAPVRTIVNTHHHGDHTFGNYLFPDATIVGHRLCRSEILARGLDSVVFPDQPRDLAEVQISPPTILVDDTAHIAAGPMTCNLTHYGRAAHTTNDLVVFVQDHGVLFAGDLAFNGSTPFALAGSVAGSIATCSELAQTDAGIVVPGHGPVTTTEIFRTVAQYYRLVEARAADALARGDDALTAAQATDLGRFAEWLAPERLVANIAVSMREQSAGMQTFDGPAIVRDMITYNGGRPLEHCQH